LAGVEMLRGLIAALAQSVKPGYAPAHATHQ
jgi:hypothetical protein